MFIYQTDPKSKALEALRNWAKSQSFNQLTNQLTGRAGAGPQGPNQWLHHQNSARRVPRNPNLSGWYLGGFFPKHFMKFHGSLIKNTKKNVSYVPGLIDSKDLCRTYSYIYITNFTILYIYMATIHLFFMFFPAIPFQVGESIKQHSPSPGTLRQYWASREESLPRTQQPRRNRIDQWGNNQSPPANPVLGEVANNKQ